MKTRYQHRGITLIELLTTVSIAAIALTLGVPSFTSITGTMHRTSVGMELLTSFALARSEAARQGVSVTLCPSSDGIACSTAKIPTWTSGWIVFTDADEDARVDAGTDVPIHNARFDSNAFSLTADASIASKILMRGNGFPAATGSFTYCDERESRELALTFVGRIEHVSTGAGCQ